MVDDVVAAVVFNPDLDKFLLLKRSESRENFPNHWEFPSGYVEDGENFETAVLRELDEETGLNGKIIRRGESFSIEIPKVMINPILVIVSSDNVVLSKEHSDFRWVDKSDLEVLKTAPKLKQDLKNVGVNFN